MTCSAILVRFHLLTCDDPDHFEAAHLDRSTGGLFLGQVIKGWSLSFTSPQFEHSLY